MREVQCVDLPTPGVPVMITLGDVRRGTMLWEDRAREGVDMIVLNTLNDQQLGNEIFYFFAFIKKSLHDYFLSSANVFFTVN